MSASVRPVADAVGRASNRDERRKRKPHVVKWFVFPVLVAVEARSAGLVARGVFATFAVSALSVFSVSLCLCG
jgi:hypothetical protein